MGLLKANPCKCSTERNIYPNIQTKWEKNGNFFTTIVSCGRCGIQTAKHTAVVMDEARASAIEDWNAGVVVAEENGVTVPKDWIQDVRWFRENDLLKAGDKNVRSKA